LQGRENVEDPKQVEQDRQRAEVFDALGHPTRIQILKVLSEGSIGFAELKKKTAIESSGHLQHHLTKLNGLIKTDEYGKYCLSDEGKDALLTVQTVENASPKKRAKHKGPRCFRVSLKPVAILLAVLLIASTVIVINENNQITGLQVENAFLSAANPEATAYYTHFGVTPSTDVNSSFTPPISLYHALMIGLEAMGWNKTSLEGMTVSISLMHQTTNSTDAAAGIQSQDVVYAPTVPTNYSDTSAHGNLSRYAWYIQVQDAKFKNDISYFPWVPPHGLSIDASTGQICPFPSIAYLMTAPDG
jgi:DNA-binding transcriptional ArsR family regulator